MFFSCERRILEKIGVRCCIPGVNMLLQTPKPIGHCENHILNPRLTLLWEFTVLYETHCKRIQVVITDKKNSVILHLIID